MRLTVEFFGTARDLTNAREAQLDLPDGSMLRDLVATLAEKYPKLIGPVVEHGATGLVAPYLFNLDGRETVSDLGVRLHDGQRIMLFLASVGG